MHAARPATARGPRSRLGAVAGLSAFALAGCVAPQGGGRGLDDAPRAPETVTVDGQSYSVAIGARGTGTRLTAEGALPVQGRALLVTAAVQLAQDQGAVAKKAARAGCASAGGRFTETALGAYDRAARAWVFAGACA